MAKRMAAEGVARQQDDIDGQNDCAHTHSELGAAGPWIDKPEGAPDIQRENYQKKQREIEEISVNILQNQRERTFTTIVFSQFANGTGRRIGPKGFIVSTAIVVARQAKAARRPKDQ